MKRDWVRITSLKTLAQFRDRIAILTREHPWIRLDADGELEVGAQAPLAAPISAPGLQLANRFATLPMQGWDGTRDGRATARVLRRWRRFGQSGAG